MAKSYSKSKGRSERGRHMGIPHAVTGCSDFRKLSPSAMKILIMIANQYNGFNNGDLQATFNLAKEWGIGSQQTLSNAIKELLKTDLIRKTREGWFQNPGRKCSLYAITWQKIDDCKGKLDVSPTQAPPRTFSLEKMTKPSTEIVASRYKKRSDNEIGVDQDRSDECENRSAGNVFSLPHATKTVDLTNLPSIKALVRMGGLSI